MGLASFFGHSTAAPDPLVLQPAASTGAEAARLTCCRAVRGLEGDSPSRGTVRRTWKMLERQMALVPAGSVPLTSADPVEDAVASSDQRGRTKLTLVDVNSFFIDRMAVTNAEYFVFVKSGGYSDLNYWPNVVWPYVVQFVDQTGNPGPRLWRDGRPPRETLDHPVTGICWYEADAFARWCGKMLPGTAEWQRAGSWHTAGEGQYRMKMYPWGDLFDVRHANVWASGIGSTVPVDRYYEACPPNGVYQLIGNVWEWVGGNFADSPPAEVTTEGLGEIRGGAFDTYFPRQATCQFRTAQPRLSRTSNTGFRCCISTSELKHRP